MDASWAAFYHSIGELKAHSDLAVVGTFTKVIGQTQDDKGVPYTDFALTVDRVLHAAAAGRWRPARCCGSIRPAAWWTT